MTTKKTFENSGNTNHSIHARLIKYLHDTLNESKEEKKVVAYKRLFTGRNILECYMNVYEYLNKIEKYYHPFDNHTYGLECYLDCKGVLNKYMTENGININTFDASTMTNEEIKDFVEKHYCENDDITEVVETIKYEWKEVKKDNREEICEGCDRIYKGKKLESMKFCSNCGTILCSCEEHDIINLLCIDCGDHW
jgi:hypothetical protein